MLGNTCPKNPPSPRHSSGCELLDHADGRQLAADAHSLLATAEIMTQVTPRVFEIIAPVNS